MSGIKDTTVTMSRRKRDQMVSNLRRAEINARRASERESAAEAARRRAEKRSSQLTNQLQRANHSISRMQQETSRQLRQANQEMSRIRQETNQAISRTRQETLSEVRSQVDDVRRKQNQRLEQMSRENTQRLNQQARDFQSRLQHQADNFNSQLESQRHELSHMVNDVKQDIREQGVRLSERMEQNRREIEQSINRVSDRLGKIEQTQQHHQELAGFWIDEVDSVFREIEEHRHELFAPGKLAHLRTALQDARSDVNDQNYGGAITGARDIFRAGLRLKEDVVNAEMEWNSWYNLLSQLYTETKNNLDDLDSLQFEFQAYNEDGEKETVSVEANVDYWTDGKLGKLKEQFRQMEQRMQNIEACTSSQLQEMMEELAAIQEHMDHLEADSRVSLQLSHERRDLACDIVEALSDGFAFDVDSSIGAYTKNEQRDSYEGTIKNPITHDQVSFRISPGENEQGLLTNHMELHYFSDSNDALLDGQMLNAITQAITDNGTSIGEMRCREGYEHRSSDQRELLSVQA